MLSVHCEAVIQILLVNDKVAIRFILNGKQLYTCYTCNRMTITSGIKFIVVSLATYPCDYYHVLSVGGVLALTDLAFVYLEPHITCFSNQAPILYSFMHGLDYPEMSILCNTGRMFTLNEREGGL